MARAANDRLRVAAQALVDRLWEIQKNDSFNAVFGLAYTHGQPYSGPSWDEPLAELMAALGTEDA